MNDDETSEGVSVPAGEGLGGHGAHAGGVAAAGGPRRRSEAERLETLDRALASGKATRDLELLRAIAHAERSAEHRRWWRSPVPLALAASLLLVAVGVLSRARPWRARRRARRRPMALRCSWRRRPMHPSPTRSSSCGRRCRAHEATASRC